MVNKRLKQQVFVSINVTLCIHGRCNCVRSKLSDFTIVEHHFVHTCVKDWVGIGRSHYVAIVVTLPLDNSASLHGVTPW